MKILIAVELFARGNAVIMADKLRSFVNKPIGLLCPRGETTILMRVYACM